MTDLYLIAHKVRGEPAFDVAQRMDCPHCCGVCNPLPEGSGYCNECDGEGYWWIIPTSGHRAYPYQVLELAPLIAEYLPTNWMLPDNWPDHYPPRASPSEPKVSLLDRLNLRPTQPPIVRRI